MNLNYNCFPEAKNYVIFGQMFRMKSTRYLFLSSLLILSLTARSQSVQRIYTYAGNGVPGFSGDGSNASGANLWGPIDVAADATGNVYISDHFNYRVRKVTPGGLITTVAGNGLQGNSGDSSLGSAASITPHSLALDPAGILHISDNASHVIRKISSTGIITRVAGLGLVGYAGDGGPARIARFSYPAGITFDKIGNLYVADKGNNVIRMINASGIVSTIAGNHTVGYSGDGSAATAAALDSPYAVAADRSGSLYIADYGNNVIRKVDTGIITTYAGTMGVYSYTGDNGPATSATFNGIRGLAVDTAGNLFISDANNNVIRKIDHVSHIITTVAGNGTYGFSGDLGYALGANLFNPYGLTVDAQGSIYIADANNERIRKTYFPAVSVSTNVAANNTGLFPNPFTNTITVTGVETTDKLSIYDVTGHQVSGQWQVSGNSQTVNTNNLAAGFYMLHIMDAEGNRKSILKMIKK
jgi:hypothetical protein